MTLLSRIVSGLERRDAPKEAYGRTGFAGGNLLFNSASRSSSGKAVTVDTALEVVPVYSAVQLIAGAIGSLPLCVYSENGDETRTEARSSRQWKLLHDRPNPEMAADELWECVATALLLWGNAFLWKRRDSLGRVSELWPLRPSRVQVGRESTSSGDSRRFFVIDGTSGGSRAYETDILHIRGLSGGDGLVGLSPVQQARQQIGNQLAQDEFQGAFWKNGTFFGGILSHPSTFSEDGQKRLQKQMASLSGSANAGRFLVAEEDMKFQSWAMPLDDAQFIEQANLTDRRVAQIMGLVPPHDWAKSGEATAMTYANTEVADLAFVKWTARRWTTRIENGVSGDASIFPAPGPKLCAEFNFDEILRADTKTRFEAYQIGINSKFLTVADVRQKEDLPPIPEPDPAPSLPAADAGDGQDVIDATPAQRTLPAPDTRGLGVLEELRAIFHPDIRVDAPNVIVNVPQQMPPDVIVNVPAQGAPVVEVTLPEINPTVNVAAPNVSVDVPTQPVQLQLEMPAEQESKKKVTFERDGNGRIKSATVQED